MSIKSPSAKTSAPCDYKKGFTQEELARRAGITSRWLGKLERGEGSMTIQTCLYLCDALNCRPNELLL